MDILKFKDNIVLHNWLFVYDYLTYLIYLTLLSILSRELMNRTLKSHKVLLLVSKVKLIYMTTRYVLKSIYKKMYRYMEYDSKCNK